MSLPLACADRARRAAFHKFGHVLIGWILGHSTTYVTLSSATFASRPAGDESLLITAGGAVGAHA